MAMPRLISNILGGVAGRFLGLLAPYIVMPWMLAYMGDRSFGLWLTATSLTSMAAFLDLGIGNATLTRLARSFATRNDALAREQITIAYAALGTVAGLAWGVGALIWWFGGLPFLGLNLPEAVADRAILAATLGAFVFGIPLSTIHRIYYARHEVWRSSLWSTVGSALAVGLSLSSILLALPVWLVALAYAAGPILMALVATLIFFARNRQIAPRAEEISVPATITLLREGLHFLGLAVLTSVFLNLDPVIIAHVAGPEAVTTYGVPAKLGSILMLLVSTLFMPLWAENGAALARGERDWVRRNTLRMSLGGTALILVAGLVLVALSGPLISLWMGRSFEGQQSVLIAMTFLSAAMAMTSPFFMVLNSQGRTAIQMVVWSLFGAVSIPLKLYFVGNDTLWAAPVISAIVYTAAITPAIAISALRILGQKHG